MGDYQIVTLMVGNKVKLLPSYRPGKFGIRTFHFFSLWLVFSPTSVRTAPSSPTLSKFFSIAVYPNPSAADFTMQLSTDPEAGAFFIIKNLLGEQVHSGSLKNAQEQIHLGGNVMDGIYLVEVHANGMVLTRQIIIQR